MAVIKRHVSLRQRTRINDGARHQPRNWNSTTPFGVGGEELGAEQTDGGEHDGREDGLMAAHGYPMPSSGSSHPAMPLATSSPALLLSSIRHATTNSSQEAGSAASSQRLLEPSYTLRVANSTITPSISARVYQTTLQYSSATPTSIPTSITIPSFYFSALPDLYNSSATPASIPTSITVPSFYFSALPNEEDGSPELGAGTQLIPAVTTSRPTPENNEPKSIMDSAVAFSFMATVALESLPTPIGPQSVIPLQPTSVASPALPTQPWISVSTSSSSQSPVASSNPSTTFMTLTRTVRGKGNAPVTYAAPAKPTIVQPYSALLSSGLTAPTILASAASRQTTQLTPLARTLFITFGVLGK
jgi:hypothetical protein